MAATAVATVNKQKQVARRDVVIRNDVGDDTNFEVIIIFVSVLYIIPSPQYIYYILYMNLYINQLTKTRCIYEISDEFG